MTMSRGLSRRAVLAGLAAGFAAPVWAKAAAEPVDAILARSRLAALSGFALVDLDGGAVLEAHRAEVAFPPASVAKIVTALYALETLGPDYRFATRLIATGPVTDGVLGGDLVLAGGGDPVLNTDGLGDLAAALAAGGLRAVNGRFLVATGALPPVALIDPGQPEAAGYNPSIAGVNLNFNRVFLRWIPGKTGPKVAFSAPGARFNVDVPSLRAEVTETVREPRRRAEGGGELWLLPRAGLRGKGGLWLPVRAPAAYAGEVFTALAGQAGTRLPAAAEVAAAPVGAVLARRDSGRCADLLRGMLFHSTNLTAEVMGLRATQLRGGAPSDLAASAAAMGDWARGRFGLRDAEFVNHSGLTDRTRLSPSAQVRVLAAAENLADLLRERAVADGNGGTFRVDGARVLCKTGTLDFVSALAGYVEGRDRRLAFAIFAADPAARAAIRPEQRAAPPGAKAWAGRARGQQHALLRRWIGLYGG